MITAAEKAAWEQQCYGCPIADFRVSLENSITFKLPNGRAMSAMSLMSDAQELMQRGQSNEARQALNRAKWLISEYIVDCHGA
jgi:hypothetical protein